MNRWLVGHDASHVVCEGSSVRKYIGHSNNLVTVSVIVFRCMCYKAYETIISCKNSVNDAEIICMYLNVT